MDIILLYILALLESSTTMIIWNSFLPWERNGMKKKLGIVFAMSLVIVLTNEMTLMFTMMINYLSLMFMVKFMFSKKPVDVFYEFCIVALANSVIQLIFTVPVMLVSSTINTMNDEHFFLQGILITFLSLLSAVAIDRWLPLAQGVEKYRNFIRGATIIAINIIIYVAVSKTLWEYNKNLILGNIFLFILIPVFVLSLNIVYIKYTIKVSEQKKMEETYDKYSSVMLTLLDDVRRVQHDYKNHMNALFGICEVASDTELRGRIQDYIKGLNTSLGGVDRIVGVENQMLAAIIYSKLCEAQKREIWLDYNVSVEGVGLPLSDFELTEITTNLLDNAFDATEKLEPKSRNVSLAVSGEPSCFSIEVKNFGDPIPSQMLNKIFHKGYTTKEDGEGHGYGLYNIKRIVEQHQGDIQLSYSGGATKFGIYFRRLSGMSGSPQNHNDEE